MEVQGLLIPVVNYHLAWDGLGGAIVMGAIAVCLLRQYVSVAPHAVVAAMVLLVLYAVCPQHMMESDYMDLRWPVMLGFLPFAGMQPVRMPARLAKPGAALFAAVLAVKLGVLSHVWYQSRSDLAQFRQAIAPVPAGSRVLVVEVGPDDNPDYWAHMPRSRQVSHLVPTFRHLGALLVIENHAFYPNFFASAFKQPVQVLPPYADPSVPASNTPDYTLLDKAVLTDEELHSTFWLRDWQSHYDYVLLTLAGAKPDAAHFMPDKLAYIGGNDMAALYSVRK